MHIKNMFVFGGAGERLKRSRGGGTTSPPHRERQKKKTAAGTALHV